MQFSPFLLLADRAAPFSKRARTGRVDLRSPTDLIAKCKGVRPF